MARVLVAEDEPGIRSFLTEALQRAGHDVTGVEDGLSAIAALRASPFDVLLTDLRMPGADGMTVVRTARTEWPDVEVIVLTAHGAVSSAVEALKLGAFDYLEKPVSGPPAIRDLVARALARRASLSPRTEHPSAALPDEIRLTWGAESMTKVVLAIDRVARSSATVLLLGDSGTGKEVLARAVHRKSPRAAGPFMAINCAVLSENLLDSELFGHEKGAFTGAHTQRRGRLELADGGTFFLDEIGELHLQLQAKLLRVLEERKFERVGGSTSVSVSVRVIAATNRDLRSMVQQGTFREDLYHRLAVFPIRVPRLCERRTDIVPLAETILANLARDAGRPALLLSPSAKAAITGGAWPGNVRELRNALERALILTDGGEIDEAALLIEPSPGETTEGPSAGATEDVSLEGLERRAIERALAATSGNRREAASRLGIGLRTLYEKLKRYGL